MLHVQADIVYPLALFVSYLAFTSVCIFLIVRHVVYRAHKSQLDFKPSLSAPSNRQGQIQVFAALSVLSLAIASYHNYNVLSTSYRNWAYEKGGEVPVFFRQAHEAIHVDGVINRQMGQWLQDIDPARELWEVSMANSTRLWWTQQLLLDAVAWTLYVSIEGQPRSPPYSKPIRSSAHNYHSSQI